MAMALLLPNDVLEVISDTLQTPELSRVCRRFFELLRHRHVSFAVDAETIAAQLTRLAALGGAVHTVDLTCQRLGSKGAAALTALQSIPSIRRLTLKMYQNAIGDTGAAGLAETLCELPRLHTVQLHLGDNAITDKGAIALAGLSALPALRDVTLSFWGNQIGDKGAQALTNFRDASLSALTLRLGSNGVGRTGALALMALKGANGLDNFELDLSFNPILADGDVALEAVVEALPIRHFCWYMCDTQFWDPDA